jgi:hypothetical protein
MFAKVPDLKVFPNKLSENMPLFLSKSEPKLARLTLKALL